MLNAKAYNVNALVVKDTADHKTPLQVWGSRKKLVVIEGPKGYVVTCSEGVHFVVKSKEDTIPVGCEPVPEDGDESFRIFPSHKTELSVARITSAPSRKVNLGTFVRTFGDRLERNYSLILRSLRDVGLNPADFPRK